MGLENLKRKASRVKWLSGERRDYFSLISRKGFTKRLKESAAKERVILRSLSEKLF